MCKACCSSGPHVIADTQPAPRLALVGGDFFVDALPAADLYLLMDLLHDWDDADAARILGAVRRAAAPGARLLIIETLVPETPGPHFGKTLDIIMLAVTGGRERTEAQHAALLATAGFRARARSRRPRSTRSSRRKPSSAAAPHDAHASSTRRSMPSYTPALTTPRTSGTSWRRSSSRRLKCKCRRRVSSTSGRHTNAVRR